MTQRKKGSLDVLVPRGLVGSGEAVLSASAKEDGLCALRISWESGQISGLEAIKKEDASSLKLLLPRLLEPHAHIDKAFSWNDFPNFKGSYEDALKANLQEHKNRTSQIVFGRADRSLTIAVKNGCRAIRSHIDSFGYFADPIWEALLELRKKWHALIELQLVALAPLEYWNTREGDLLASRLGREGGLLGGVLAPPFNRELSSDLLAQMLKLANQYNCGIDLHIDESDTEPAVGLNQLVQVLDHNEVNVSITCSHASSMGLLSPVDLRRLSERLAHHHVNVIALPLTNFWLLGRQSKTTPLLRPLAPISQLQKAGVRVAIGGDNVQDSWFPAGTFDPLALMSFSMPLTQLAPWQRRGLAPFTTSAAAVMDLKWDGIVRIGSPADFVLLEASSWSEALSKPPQRKVLINGNWLDETIIPKTNPIEHLN
ncbi:amidohydrolase family protein [Prochlorococcus sp. MIT 1307]|uniref:amidohydrolase family protein n=1 Tax=Prochlorococcus sp. MIT 1307 TaxID=3096219 RepID=UPI002A765637|nr:amidohydrolase family protein [Prochlorococcus sp. MIT 1307]